MISKISYLNLCISVSCAKLLFLPCYFSTDFDVHRNWLAITFNLPIDKWYFDTTSEWTLDYPPLFALFEYLLSLMAGYFDLSIVKLTKEPIRTDSTILFQRVSVIASDLLYYYAIYKFCRAAEDAGYWIEQSGSKKKAVAKKQGKSNVKKKIVSPDLTDLEDQTTLIESFLNPKPSFMCVIFLMFQPGLLMVDHIHFQYNAFLSGYLLMSMAYMINRQYVKASLWFSLLLNLKHIYLYCAPAYGLYLLFNYCIKIPRDNIFRSLTRLIKLTIIVLIVFCITFLPYSSLDQMSQIFKRLFPFKRGLSHAYWAPNFWSIYNFIDKLLNISNNRSAKSNMTGGLVGEFEHSYLPTIRPWMTFCLVVVLDMVGLNRIFTLLSLRGKGLSTLFLRAVVLCAFTSFQFGWHVHEKAILMVLLPMIPLSLTDQTIARVFIRLSLTGTYSLFPLLFKPGEWFIKVLLALIYQQNITNILFVHHAYTKRLNKGKDLNGHNNIFKLDKFDQLYLMGMILVELYITCIHGTQFLSIFKTLSKFEFLPLMLVSVYSEIGITYSYICTYYEFMRCCPAI